MLGNLIPADSRTAAVAAKSFVTFPAERKWLWIINSNLSFVFMGSVPALFLLIFHCNLPLCLEVDVDFFFDFLSDVTCDDNFAEESACIINF